jgi:ribosomal protein L37AE/L43A
MATLSKDEKRREAARDGQKKAMRLRVCPKCRRGNALTRDDHGDGWIGKHCRYCDYATGRWL